MHDSRQRLILRVQIYKKDLNIKQGYSIYLPTVSGYLISLITVAYTGLAVCYSVRPPAHEFT